MPANAVAAYRRDVDVTRISGPYEVLERGDPLST